MNREAIKAMNRKPSKKCKLSQWWIKNGYKVRRIILFPIWIYVVIAEKINNWLDSLNAWSDERAQKILSYYIPRRAHWNEEEKILYFCNNGGWSQKEVKWKDRRWWNCHRGFCGGRIQKYLIEEFELDGFEKIIEDSTTYDWVEISFKLIQE